MRRVIISLWLVAATTMSVAAQHNRPLTYATPESVGMDGDYLRHTIDSIANHSIAERCFPGCQILVARQGKIVFNKSYGHHTYEQRRDVENSHIYDIASCTKVMAATICLMRLVEQKRIELDKPICHYLEEFKGSNKEELTLREMLAPRRHSQRASIEATARQGGQAAEGDIQLHTERGVSTQVLRGNIRTQR